MEIKVIHQEELLLETDSCSCMECGTSRYQIHQCKDNVIDGFNYLLCNDCLIRVKKIEPDVEYHPIVIRSMFVIPEKTPACLGEEKYERINNK